jgi:outer membrane scaffolding protein for murein synthesis (MipA/OmpV family)
MKNSIKLTTLATWLLMAAIGAYLGMEYQTLKGAAAKEPVVQQQAQSSYDTKGLANLANAQQYIDIPQKPEVTDGTY